VVVRAICNIFLKGKGGKTKTNADENGKYDDNEFSSRFKAVFIEIR